MSRRAASTLAWSLWALFAALLVLTVWQAWGGPTRTDALVETGAVGFATVGAIVASRRPGNAVGWLLIAVALAFAISGFGDVYVLTRSYPGYLAVAWFAGWMYLVWLLLIGIFLPLVFPNGRLLSRRWRPVMWLGVAAMAASIVGAAFAPGELAVSVSVQNPLGATGTTARVVAAVAGLGDILVAIALLLAAASLVLRFRRAEGVERQQLKWFAFAGLLAGGGLVLAMTEVLFPGGWRDPVGSVGWTIFVLAFLVGIPAATGIAILRHRLYDIDVVINRTLVYGSLTAALAGVYLASVLVLRLLLSPVTGQSDLAVAGSTLAVAALFRPARMRFQNVVDQRFYRRTYDAARTLEAFAGRLREQLDVQLLASDLQRVAHDTMQPTHISLWVRS